MMIRVALTAFRANVIKTVITAPITRKILQVQPRYAFSTAANHPTIDKIIQSDDDKSLQETIPQVGGLGEKNRELALKLILNKVFSAKVSITTLDNLKLLAQLAKHPQMMLQAYLFRIKQLMKSLNESLLINDNSKRVEVFNLINDSFLKSFENLKKIDGSIATKYEVMLHKRFADYNLLYLSKCVKAQDRNQILQKSRDFYLSTLVKMGTLINDEKQKLTKIEASTPQQKQKSQQEQLKVNALKENIRMLIQTNSQNIFHLFMVEKELSNKKSREDAEMAENIIGLLPYFQKSLNYYQIFTKMTAFSIFYHRIKKLSLEINYYSKVIAFRKYNNDQKERKENQKKLWNQLTENFDKLYEETINDIEIITNQPKHIGSLQQMTLILLNIRIHKSLREKLSNEAFKEMLFQEVGAILNLISSQEDKRIISFHLSKVVKQMLEERKNKGQATK